MRYADYIVRQARKAVLKDIAIEDSEKKKTIDNIIQQIEARIAEAENSGK